MKNNLIKQCIAEFLGTFALVFFGCGSMILYELNLGAISSDVIPIIFGLIIAVMVYALSHISGAHFNPAVSIAFFQNKTISIQQLFAYIPAQIIGAVSGSSMHKLFFGSNHGFGMTINKLSFYQGTAFEILMSMFLMLTIISVSTDDRVSKAVTGISIGGVIAVCSFIGGPFTGASMNPARSLGPAILSNNFHNIIIYILAPAVGTILGVLIYNYIKEN
jgi:MIP family channel proteins